MQKTTSKCKFIPHPQLNTFTNSNGTNSSLYKTMNDMSEPPNIVIRTRNLTRTVKGDSLFKNVARLKLSNKKKGNIKMIPLSLPKQSLLKGVKNLEFINKPMNVKLNKILDVK